MEALKNEAARVLRERRRALLDLVQHADNEEANQAATREDRSDQVAGDELSEVSDRLSDSERRELNEIEGALRRIEAGTYGHCESCGQAVGRQRLRAIPEARYCISCSTSHAAFA